jgi:lipocalin
MLATLLLSLAAASVLKPVESKSLSPLCTDVTSKSCDIDNTKYLGQWYEIGTSSFIRNTFQKDCHCAKADYKLKPDGQTLLVTNGCVKPSTLELETVQGDAQILGNGLFKVNLGGPPMPGNNPNYIVSNVWVDAEGNYQRALVTAAKGAPPQYQLIWILSRTSVISEEDKAETLAYARAMGFNPERAKFAKTACSEIERPINP